MTLHRLFILWDCRWHRSTRDNTSGGADDRDAQGPEGPNPNVAELLQKLALTAEEEMAAFSEAFCGRDDDDDYSESVREGLRRWRRVVGAQYEAALAAAAYGDRARADADAEAPLPAPCQVSQL